MKLLLDAQLSPKVGQALNASRYTTSLVREVNLRDSEDLDIWEYALTHGFVIVTKDRFRSHV